MRTFDSYLLDQQILSILIEKGPLEHQGIVNNLAESLGLSEEELKETEENNPNMKKFYHLIADREVALQRRGYIENNKNQKKWEIKHLGKLKFNEGNKIISDYSILLAVKSNLNNIRPDLCLYKKEKAFLFPIEKNECKIGLLCQDKYKNYVIIEVEKEEQDVDKRIKLVKDKLAKNNETVTAIIIKKLESNSIEQKQKSKHSILYYKLKPSFSDKQIDRINGIYVEPLNENAFSDYLNKNLALLGLPNVTSLREKHLEGKKRSIDILCQKDNDEYVVIENKIRQTEYHVVGQILYYINSIRKEHPKANVKGLIILPDINNREKSETIECALKECQNVDIQIKYYSLAIEFLPLNNIIHAH